MKGPYLFFIEYLGQLVSYGRLGIFLVQWANLLIVCLIACKLFGRCRVSNRIIQMLLLCPIAYIASFTLEGGNLTEEFSLVPLFSCLYLCLDFFDDKRRNKCGRNGFLWFAGIWNGVCFGVLAMIRITNTALIIAILISVMTELIRSRRFQDLFVCIGAFLCGLVLSAIPVILFAAKNGIFHEMMEAVFELGFRYSREKTLAEHLLEVINANHLERLLLLIVPCAIPLLLRWRTGNERFFVLTGSILTFCAIISGNSFFHYYTLCLPLILVCEISIVEAALAKQKRKVICGVILAGAVLALQFNSFHLATGVGYSMLFRQDLYEKKQTVQEISSRIPREDSNSVYCYDISVSWYTYADLFPCIRYCGWQEHYLSLMPEIYGDLEETFQKDPPKWLVLPETYGTIPAFLEEKIHRSYLCMYSNREYALYHLQERQMRSGWETDIIC